MTVAGGVGMGRGGGCGPSRLREDGRYGRGGGGGGGGSSGGAGFDRSAMDARSGAAGGKKSRALMAAMSGEVREATTDSDGAAGGGNGGNGGKKLVCDRCDKNHATARCPYFKKEREKHPDATRRAAKNIGKAGGAFSLRASQARVVRQPGDGSCLFHSLSYGLGGGGGGGGAGALRREIASFVAKNPTLEIAGDPLSDWVAWDSGRSVAAYARAMASGGWGGGIEMAACARLKQVNVHVYERQRGGNFKRISCFDCSEVGGGRNARKTVHVLYCGGIHFDALVPSSSRM